MCVLALLPSLLCLLLPVTFAAGASECKVDPSSSSPTCSESTAAKGGTFANPLITDAEHELADPAFLDDRPRTQSFYIYPTGDQSNFDVYSSQDMVTWLKHPSVLNFSWPCPPAFIFGPWYASMSWAPDIFFDPDSERYYLYYTRCLSIGIAVSDSPLGPFTDLGTLINWAIDAHMFRDSDGRMYLYYGKLNLLHYWSSMEHIYVQPMANATHMDEGSDAKELLKPSQPWEFLHAKSLLAARGINEGPWMVKVEQTYYLMYSGAGAETEHYALGYATAASPLGPFTKSMSNPITLRGPGVIGPGHHSVWRDDDEKHWCIYHAKDGAAEGWNRFLLMDPMQIHADGSLSINTSLGVEQPAPRIAVS